VQLAGFMCRTDMKFNTRDELAVLNCTEGTRVLERMNITVQIWDGIAIDGVPPMARRNSGMSTLITKDVKNAIGHNFTACHYQIWCIKNIYVWNLSKWPMLSWGIKACLTTLDQKEWINIKIFWVKWNASMGMFSAIEAFIGWFVGGCLYMCMI